MSNGSRRRPRRDRPVAQASPASTREARREARRQAKAAEFEARRRAQRLRRVRNIAALVLVLALGAGFFVGRTILSRRADSRLNARLAAGSCRVDAASDAGSTHVPTAPAYTVDPPAGGNHLASPARPAVYSEEDTPEDGNLVHSMEHGDVVLWYRPGLGPIELDTLKDIQSQFAGDVLVVPRVSLSDPVAATAWHRRMLCRSFEADSLREFVTGYRDRGPEKVPD